VKVFVFISLKHYVKTISLDHYTLQQKKTVIYKLNYETRLKTEKGNDRKEFKRDGEIDRASKGMSSESMSVGRA